MTSDRGRASMNNTSSDTKSRGALGQERSVTRGITAIAFPAAGYLVVYAHECGFLSAFNIPTAIVTLDLITVLQVSLVLVGALVILFWIGNLVSMLWPESHKLTWIHLCILRDGAIAAAGAALVFLWSRQRELGVTLVCAGGFFAFMDFVWPLITQRGRGSYREKLEAADRIDRDTKTLFDRIASVYGTRVLVFLLVVGTLAAFSYYRGLYAAEQKVEYLVLGTADGREAVVLRQYHDRMICAPFDREMQQLEAGFFVLEADSVLLLIAEEVGPLIPWTEQ